MMDLTLVLSISHFWPGFQPILNMQNSPPRGKRAVLGKNCFLTPGGAEMTQVWCKELNIGKTNSAECLLLLLMLRKHLRALFGGLSQ